MPEQRPFVQLCQIADRNGLVVEVMRTPKNKLAIWVFPSEAPNTFEVADVEATMRIGVVATPFMDSLPFDGVSPQLIAMLAERGYI